MERVDAVLLAGGKQGSRPIREENKAFLTLNGVPLLIHVLRSLLQSERVGRVVIVGPSRRIKDTIRSSDLTDSSKSRVTVVEQRETLLQNGLAAFVATLPGVDPDAPWESLRGSAFAERCSLFLPCDIPLATSYEIDEFVEKSDMDRYDYCFGLTSEEVLAAYYPTGHREGIRMAYFNMKEGRFRQNNLHLAKPLKVENLIYVDMLYRIRYQKELKNVIKGVFMLLSSGRHLLRLVRLFLQMQIAMQLDLRGKHNWFYRLAVRWTPIGRVTRSMGNVMKTRLHHVVTSYGGAALDVDNAEHLAIAERMAEVWREYQARLHRGLLSR